MDDLTYTLRQLCQRNRDGSHNTQADRMRSLTLVARQLREAGFRQLKASRWAREDRAHHHSTATRGASGRARPGRERVIDSSAQELHPAAACLRWPVQKGGIERHAWTAASVRAEPL